MEISLFLEIQSHTVDKGPGHPRGSNADPRALLMWGNAPAVPFLLPDVPSPGLMLTWSSGLKGLFHCIFTGPRTILAKPKGNMPCRRFGLDRSQIVDKMLLGCEGHSVGCICVCACVYIGVSWLLRETKLSSSSAREHAAGTGALASPSSCVPACARQSNLQFLHSSCSGQNNLGTDHLVQPST